MPDLYDSEVAWYCFQALCKKEHIAARLLRSQGGLDVLCPRISYVKVTKRGKVRFIEPLFPGYIFVQADMSVEYRRIMATQGVRKLVAYGDRVPKVPDYFILELKERIDSESLCFVPEPALVPGSAVKITQGPFANWEAIVAGKVSAHDRIRLLLEFLGQQLSVDIPVHQVYIETLNPKTKVWES